MTAEKFRIRYRTDEERDVDTLAHDLSDWAGVILKFEGILNWESPRLLIIILTTLSALALLFHLYSPTILATVGWCGLILSILDYFGPLLSARIIPKLPPFEADRRYREFCRRLVHARYLVVNLIVMIRDLRANHPILYLFTAVPLLLIGGFIGLQVNNLLLLYLLVVACLLTPGIRHKGILSIVIYPVKKLVTFCSTRIPSGIFRSIRTGVQWSFRWIRTIYCKFAVKKEN
ncbi:unnamed protein product [Calicophoron daubneyi]|uniref:ADP-ribosylation factor-like protein 6-interacting protein 1 n=1 Tax=Calicophoron daubneyi TaxID=300641 RepID=A0AAV2TUQ0_CALDB